MWVGPGLDGGAAKRADKISADQRGHEPGVSLGVYCVESEVLQVVEKMERETGIEPATNSLEG